MDTPLIAFAEFLVTSDLSKSKPYKMYNSEKAIDVCLQDYYNTSIMSTL